MQPIIRIRSVQFDCSSCFPHSLQRAQTSSVGSCVNCISQSRATEHFRLGRRHRGVYGSFLDRSGEDPRAHVWSAFDSAAAGACCVRLSKHEMLQPLLHLGRWHGCGPRGLDNFSENVCNISATDDPYVYVNLIYIKHK